MNPHMDRARLIRMYCITHTLSSPSAAIPSRPTCLFCLVTLPRDRRDGTAEGRRVQINFNLAASTPSHTKPRRFSCEASNPAPQCFSNFPKSRHARRREMEKSKQKSSSYSVFVFFFVYYSSLFRSGWCGGSSLPGWSLPPRSSEEAPATCRCCRHRGSCYLPPNGKIKSTFFSGPPKWPHRPIFQFTTRCRELFQHFVYVCICDLLDREWTCETII